ncbi:MAG: hypothetical protein ACYTEK_24280 [Planctomycetota bacterium]
MNFAHYTFSLRYDPNAKGPFVSGSGVVEEAPKSIEEHALYRKLREKAKQHKNLKAPYVVCVGSDQSPILHYHQGHWGVRERDVITSIFKRHSGISAVYIINIEWKHQVMRGSRNIAKARLYINDKCDYPLSRTLYEKIDTLDFNRWKYSFRLEQWDQRSNDHLRYTRGDLVLGCGNRNRIRMEIPAKLIMESLAGTNDLIKAYSRGKDDHINKLLDTDWKIKSCTFGEGDIQKGKDDIVILELERAPTSVYWPKRKS